MQSASRGSARLVRPWVALALIFNAGLWFWLDATAGREMANLRPPNSSPAT